MQITKQMKICSICGEEKELSEFYSQNKKRKDGKQYVYHNPECKECTKKRSNNWQYINYEQSMISKKKYNNSPTGREKAKLRGRTRRENGGDKEWHDKNPQKLKLYSEKRESKIHEISANEWENCKNYFNYRCAYCGLPIEEHYIKYRGKLILGDFHRDHVDDNGENDLSNCIPGCKTCNSEKHDKDWDEWYINNENYNDERYNKIVKWLREDYIKYKEK
jgi:hypothetical protein